MKTVLLAISALAVINGMPAPVIAGTWITYRDETDWKGDRKQRSYQIDVASIAEHNGWTHANHRICLEYMTDCRRVTTVSAHCKDRKLKESSDIIHAQRNGNEWWTESAIFYGTRYKFVSKEFLKSKKERLKQVDAGKTKAFNFLCS